MLGRRLLSTFSYRATDIVVLGLAYYTGCTGLKHASTPSTAHAEEQRVLAFRWPIVHSIREAIRGKKVVSLLLAFSLIQGRLMSDHLSPRLGKDMRTPTPWRSNPTPWLTASVLQIPGQDKVQGCHGIAEAGGGDPRPGAVLHAAAPM